MPKITEGMTFDFLACPISHDALYLDRSTTSIKALTPDAPNPFPVTLLRTCA